MVSSFCPQPHYVANRIIEEGTPLGAPPVSPLADGYVVLTKPTEFSQKNLERMAAQCLENDRCLTLYKPQASTEELLLRTGSSLGLQLCRFAPSAEQIEPPTLDISFLTTDRAVARQSQSARLSLFQAGGNPPAEQSVTFVGIGSSTELISAKVRDLIVNAGDLVLFHRSFEETVRHLNPSGNLYVLPYFYEDFDRNILLIDGYLSVLNRMGVSHVTVLTEGNPQIYDIAGKLCRENRVFRYIEMTPVGVQIAEKLGNSLGTSLLDPGHVYLSGFVDRHARSKSGLLDEVIGYSNVGLTCILVEMYSAEIAPIVCRLRALNRRKWVFVVSNAFSARQKIFFLDTAAAQFEIAQLDDIKGELTTVVITDAASDALFPATAVLPPFGFLQNNLLAST
ncbi:hypothetical protein ABLO27_12835 [Roseibium sp. SCPC15]|uniref:hypothetical protein n=1 Tax=Roseibium sp. SCP15 TaxID=3141376 RepID=UPI0033386688